MDSFWERILESFAGRNRCPSTKNEDKVPLSRQLRTSSPPQMDTTSYLNLKLRIYLICKQLFVVRIGKLNPVAEKGFCLVFFLIYQRITRTSKADPLPLSLLLNAKLWRYMFLMSERAALTQLNQIALIDIVINLIASSGSWTAKVFYAEGEAN